MTWSGTAKQGSACSGGRTVLPHLLPRGQQPVGEVLGDLRALAAARLACAIHQHDDDSHSQLWGSSLLDKRTRQ